MKEEQKKIEYLDFGKYRPAEVLYPEYISALEAKVNEIIERLNSYLKQKKL